MPNPPLQACAATLLLLLLATLAPSEVLGDSPPAPFSPAPPTTFAVSIAVPEEQGRRIVQFSTGDPHVDVVVQNISSQPQDVYAEDCSDGFSNLHLEITAIDGVTLPTPQIVERVQGSWFRNRVRLQTVEPGASIVREVHFTHDYNFIGAYRTFPPMKAGDFHKIRMRAVFTVPADSNNLPHWTGAATSTTDDYYITQFSP